MTTIAYDGQTLAADTQTTKGDLRLCMNAQKIFEPNPGETWYVNGQRAIAFGVAGKLLAAQEIRKALVSCMSGYSGLVPETRFPKGYTLNYIVIAENGDVYTGGQYEDEEVPWMAKVSAPIAIGSGSELALGAMAAGAPADASIGIASQFDVNTGPKVDSFTFQFKK